MLQQAAEDDRTHDADRIDAAGRRRLWSGEVLERRVRPPAEAFRAHAWVVEAAFAPLEPHAAQHALTAPTPAPPAGNGAVLVGTGATGTTLRDLLRVADLAPVPADVIARYDLGSTHEGDLVFEPGSGQVPAQR